MPTRVTINNYYVLIIYYASHKCFNILTQSSQQAYEEFLFDPHFKDEIQRHQEVKKLAQSPMTSVQQSHTLGHEHLGAYALTTVLTCLENHHQPQNKKSNRLFLLLTPKRGTHLIGIFCISNLITE